MNRNTEAHFGSIPKIHQNRSKFDMSHSKKLTFNCSDCVPIFVDADILPGDTVTMDMAEVVRMATPIFPVMDNMVLDLYWFFVPHRLVWEHWQAFWGENDDPWTQQTEYEIPQIEAPSGGWQEDTIADYMGLPTYVEGISINALPFRAYAKIWSDWFRDENLKASAHYYTDETTRKGSNGNNYVTDAELGGKCCKGAKLHDYFTSALPSPQKGQPVAIPLGTQAPVYAKDEIVNTQTWSTLKWGTADGQKLPAARRGVLHWQNDNFEPDWAQTTANNTSTFSPTEVLTPMNLWTDLEVATSATINQLRTAFAIQKYYENAGRAGTRYIEYLRSVFGVESSDARLQRSEYLGGQRIPINMDQILQTSATDAITPQGNTAGFSCTISKESMFTKSFEEHGTLMCIALARTEKSYQQGIHKMWSRRRWVDFYNPYFANLGETIISNKELYAQGNEQDDEAFGYQEAWAEYRYKTNSIAGHMRSNSPSGSLDAWHYADDYKELPRLSGEWIDEDKSVVDRTIAVTSQISNQLIGDFYFKCAYTRCMPVYSVPGLIDHV